MGGSGDISDGEVVVGSMTGEISSYRGRGEGYTVAVDKDPDVGRQHNFKTCNAGLYIL
jgi:hypothetical protein